MLTLPSVSAQTRDERGEEGAAPHQGRQHNRQVLARHLPRLLPPLQHRLLVLLHAGRDARREEVNVRSEEVGDSERILHLAKKKRDDRV